MKFTGIKNCELTNIHELKYDHEFEKMFLSFKKCL